MSSELSRDQMAWRAAQDLADGTYVNLGIGIPVRVADFIPKDVEVVIHAEPTGCVVEREQLKAAHSEHGPDIVGLQHAGECFAAGHLIRGRCHGEGKVRAKETL